MRCRDVSLINILATPYLTMTCVFAYNTIMSKSELRQHIKDATKRFLDKGGKITVVKSKKSK